MKIKPGFSTEFKIPSVYNGVLDVRPKGIHKLEILCSQKLAFFFGNYICKKKNKQKEATKLVTGDIVNIKTKQNNSNQTNKQKHKQTNQILLVWFGKPHVLFFS